MLSLSGWRRRNSIKLSRRQNTASRHMLVLFRSNFINLVFVCRSFYCYYANTLKIRIALFLYILLAIQHRSNIGISFLMANLVRSKLNFYRFWFFLFTFPLKQFDYYPKITLYQTLISFQSLVKFSHQSVQGTPPGVTSWLKMPGIIKGKAVLRHGFNTQGVHGNALT